MISDEEKRIVEEQIQKDDETTACQLHVLLVQQRHRFDLRTAGNHWVVAPIASSYMMLTSRRDWSLPGTTGATTLLILS